MKLHNIGVPELAHDGSLLKELDSVLLQGRRLQCLDGHLHSPTGGLPHPLFHIPKLARTNELCDSEGKSDKQLEGVSIAIKLGSAGMAASHSLDLAEGDVGDPDLGVLHVQCILSVGWSLIDTLLLLASSLVGEWERAQRSGKEEGEKERKRMEWKGEE